jgi:hypothetical protein
MERRFLEQPLQLAFYGTPKNRYHNLDTKEPRLCTKSQRRVFLSNYQAQNKKTPATGNKLQVVCDYTYFPAHKTHFFPRKM